MGTITEVFAAQVFNDAVMKEKLPRDVYKAMMRTIYDGQPLDRAFSSTVASAMREWATSRGATHYSHWFHPLTNSPAEKHDSFIAPQEGRDAIEFFSGKTLLQGEPDASSFPSGGLRGTCNARGYTVWDPTSYAFVKNHCLYIPACFISYTGEALDRKIPLLRSVEALSKQAVRILHLCGKTDVRSVTTTAGPEQEYFLIPYELYEKRRDLIYTGRTLFGAKPPKTQQLEDVYFSAIRPEVKAFMEEVNAELWKLGINAVTEHNEAAPCQHELAPVFSMTNTSVDANSLAMQVMQDVAKKHGLVCLLHEKPFAGINGSGKHNNWSMATDLGENLFDPTADPYHNTQFLLFLAAVLRAVSRYSELLRISVASAGNDHRLGALEAPPAIISVYLGDELTELVETIASGKKYTPRVRTKMSVGVSSIPLVSKDTGDRNRTSPFAFTGNKFEFRMSGSSQSIADPNTMINTVVAQVLCEFADKLERKSDFEAAARKLIRTVFKEEKDRIIFSGNGYSAEWEKLAAERGLPNLRATPDAAACFDKPEYLKLFEKHKVMSAEEVACRKAVMFETYSSTVLIEAATMSEMVTKEIMPACIGYSTELSVAESTAAAKLASEVNVLTDALYDAVKTLDRFVKEAKAIENAEEKAFFVKETLRPAMSAVRKAADSLEHLVGKDYWPFPTYGDLLYY